MARNAEEVIEQIRDATSRGRDSILPHYESLLLLDYVEWLRQQFALVQEERSLDRLDVEAFKLELSELCSGPIIPPDDGDSDSLPNKIKRLRRENACLRSQLGEL